MQNLPIKKKYNKYKKYKKDTNFKNCKKFMKNQINFKVTIKI